MQKLKYFTEKKSWEIAQMKIKSIFLIITTLSILSGAMALGEINYCFILPFMRSRADITVLEMKSNPRFHVKRGDYITSSTKFMLNSGIIKTARIRSYIYKNALRLYTFDMIVDRKIIGQDLPIGPGVYTINVKQVIFDYSPIGLYNTKTKLYVNGKEFQCVLKDIYVKGNE